MRSGDCTREPKSAKTLSLNSLAARLLVVWASFPAIVLGSVTAACSQTNLLREDFEDSNLVSRGWFDISLWGVELFISTAEKRNGNASLEVRYRSGSTGPSMRHQISGQDRVYTRYYRKWAPNWAWETISGPHDTYLFAMYGQQYFPPTQTYLTVYTDSAYLGPPAWQFGTVGLITRALLQGRDYWLPSSLAPPPPPFELNRWYCIETLATMNTSGNADGRLQLWLDGTPIYDLTGLALRDANNSSLQFDQFMFGPFYHGGSPQIQSTWIDALVIANDRVGCLGGSDTTTPALPTNLRVGP